MDFPAAILESGGKLGYDKLKEKQVEAAVSLVQGNDAFVSLPTGDGKSVVHALSPHAFNTVRGTCKLSKLLCTITSRTKIYIR